MIQLEQQQHGEFWVGWVGRVGRVVGNIPTTYIQLTLWLDQQILTDLKNLCVITFITIF